MSARFFRESGWYHGSFTPFVPILRGRKAFFITTVMDDTRRARRLGAPHRTAADDFRRRAEVVTPYELSALTLSQNHIPKENWYERKLQGILQTAKEQLAAAKDSRALDEARVKFLGKRGELTALLRA